MDVVILDMNMPGMGGRETLLNLRRTNPGLPVVVSTGHVESGLLALVAADRHCSPPGPSRSPRDDVAARLEAAVAGSVTQAIPNHDCGH